MCVHCEQMDRKWTHGSKDNQLGSVAVDSAEKARCLVRADVTVDVFVALVSRFVSATV